MVTMLWTEAIEIKRAAFGLGRWQGWGWGREEEAKNNLELGLDKDGEQRPLHTDGISQVGRLRGFTHLLGDFFFTQSMQQAGRSGYVRRVHGERAGCEVSVWGALGW